MATLPAEPAATPPRQLLPLFAAVAAGFAAAATVLLTIHEQAIAVGFVATGVLVAGGIYAARHAFQASPTAAADPDWSVARALAAASDDALAVTDRAGRLICANDRYEALFAGFPTPPALPVDEAGITDLSAAGRAAWRDGAASVERLLARGTPLRAEIER